MAIKNKRIIVQEAELVDDSEIELTDILGSASKTEKAILDLCDKCLAFKNDKLKKMVLQVKARAAAVTEYISELGVNGMGGSDTNDQEITNGMDDDGIDSSNLNGKGDRQRLDMPEASSMGVVESAKQRYLKRKKLKEADLEMEADEKLNAGKQTNEELDKEKSVIKTNTFDKSSPIKEDGENPSMGDKVVIDLSEPFENVVKGLDPNEFETFKRDVISHLEGSIDSVEQKKDPTIADEFTKSIEALSMSKSVEDFDMGMDQIYDFADSNDILVETIKRK